MIANPFAGVARVGWMEFWSHLRSPRLLILVLLFALLVFATSYGFSQGPSMGFTNVNYIYAHPVIRNESDGAHYLIVIWVADLRGTPAGTTSISVYNGSFAPYGGAQRTLIVNLTTNSTGWTSADLGVNFPGNTTFFIQDNSPRSPANPSYIYFDPGLANHTFTLGVFGTSSSSGPTGSESIFYTQVLTLDGYPATGADVYRNATLVGHPNANGYFSAGLQAGIQTVNVSYKGYEESNTVSGGNPYGPVYENGADVVLLTMTAFFGLLLPIAAIAISFDAVARERAQGSLEILLAKRVRREGVLVGKFLGAFASAGIPVTAVLLAGVGLLTLVSGKSPTGSFVAAVVGSSLFLVAVYILLMLLFSTLAKSVGTAVVFGVVLWLFFNLFFSFITLFIMLGTGGSYFNPGTYGTLIALQLFDPNLVFSMLVGLAIPGTGGYSGMVPNGYISASTVVIAAIAWIVALFALALFVFRTKAES